MMAARAIGQSGRPLAVTPDISALLADHAAVAIGVSGGKDSQAAALATVALLDRLGHSGPRILVHADLGTVEWNASLPECRKLAAHLGLELVVVRRNAGDLMQRWEARWASSVRRYEMLSTVTLVPCWSTPSLRFCTSEMKTHIIRAELRRRFKGQAIVNVTGVRRAESAARARGSIADIDSHGIANWRPLSDWTEADVFSEIADKAMQPHPAYHGFGRIQHRLTRVSCRFCIMSSLADLQAATAHEETHDLYRRQVRLEAASTFAFQGTRWLGDVAPHLLDADLADALAWAKAAARQRIMIEASITTAMKYVKGWPTRMLTDDEADILAVARTDLAALLRLDALHLTRDSIHGRYAELIAERERKAA